MSQITYCGITDTGKKRKNNQDSILTYEDSTHDFYLFAVADGMGGYSDGEVASRMITDGLKRWAVTLFYGEDQAASESKPKDNQSTLDMTEQESVTEESKAVQDEGTEDDDIIPEAFDFESVSQDDQDAVITEDYATEYSATGELSAIEVCEALKAELHKLNKKIHTQLNRNQICGSTVIVLFLYKGSYAIVNAGDSRVYRLEGLKARSLMIDDIWENRNQEALKLTKEQQQKHPHRGRLVNAMGTTENVKLYTDAGALKKRDVFLLCSDGLYKYCDQKRINASLRWSILQDPKKRVKNLLEEVYKTGAKDNISIIIVKCNI